MLGTLQCFKGSKVMDNWCSQLSGRSLKRYLQVTTMTMRQGKADGGRTPCLNTVDIVSILAQNKSVAQNLASDPEILEMLIIGVRCRTHLSEFSHCDIIVILYILLCEYDVLPKRYHFDLMLALNDLKEIRWQDISVFSQKWPKYAQTTLIERMLIKLFGVPRLERVNLDEFMCSICQSDFDYPHTLECGHSVCYGCLAALMGSNQNWGQNVIQGHRIRPNDSSKCPLCRKHVGHNMDAFQLNPKLLQQMNKATVRTQCDETKFQGVEHEFWKRVATEHKPQFDDICSSRKSALCIIDELLSKFEHNIVIEREFTEFCEFMQLKTWTPRGKEVQMKNAEAMQCKQSGNQCFKQKAYNKAIGHYQQALRACPLTEDVFRCKVYSNMTLCHQKLGNHFASYRAAQRGLSLHRTAFWQALEMTKLNAKLQRNMCLALRGLLTEQGALNACYRQIRVGISNCQCPNRRMFDVMLYQSLWDFNGTQSQVLFRQAKLKDTEFEKMNKVRDENAELLEMSAMESGIANYLKLNFDEYQLLEAWKRSGEPARWDAMTANVYEWEIAAAE